MYAAKSTRSPVGPRLRLNACRGEVRASRERSLAVLAGLEPTTRCLEGSCSVQTSYRTISQRTAGIIAKTQPDKNRGSAMTTSDLRTNVLHEQRQRLLSLAEGGGFEPPVDLRPHNLSKVAPSTTRTPFQSLSVRSASDGMVPEEGLEPSRTRVRQILSLLRLPLRHSGGFSPWSGRRESNPRSQLGRLELCH